MKTAIFIARRILSGDKSNFSRPIVRLSILSISLGVAVMIVAVAVTSGFKRAISEKVIGFGSHIRITSYDMKRSYETTPVSMNQPFYSTLSEIPGIRHIQVYATKSGLIKTSDQIHGIIFKGIWTDFDWSFFKDKIVEGQPVYIDPEHITDKVIISKRILNKLKFSLGDEMRVYFINPDELVPRGRKFIIAGVYETGLEEFDELYVLGDIRHVQRLSNWDADEVSGFEVFLENPRKLDQIAEEVYFLVGFELDTKTIRELYPQIFEWLDLQDMNVIIILTLMIAVAGITMISTLLVLILEKTSLIGILKSLGARNKLIRQIFLIKASYIILQGLFFGNLLGLAIVFLQEHYQLFKLDQESYYVSYVPMKLDGLQLILLDAGTVILCLMFLLIPSHIITRITPVKAIRWE